MGPLPVPAVSDALPKTYDPAGTESRWQQAWEASGAFHPDPVAPGQTQALHRGIHSSYQHQVVQRKELWHWG